MKNRQIRMAKTEATVPLQIALTTDKRLDVDFKMAAQMLYELQLHVAAAYDEHVQTYGLHVHDSQPLFSMGDCNPSATELLRGSALETFTVPWKRECVILDRYEL